MNEESPSGPGEQPPHPQEIRREMKRLLAGCEPMRQSFYQGRKLCGHLQNPPRYALHLERLRELENLLRRRRVEDWELISDLHTTFMLDLQADMAASKAEVSERMVGFLDEVVQRAEDRKYTMPQEQRDNLEDLMHPYVDKIREEMLGELPIAVRRELEAKKQKLAEDGTL